MFGIKLKRTEKCDKEVGFLLSSHDSHTRPHLLIYKWNTVNTYYFSKPFLKPYKDERVVYAKRIGLTLNYGKYDHNIIFQYGADKGFLRRGSKIPTVYKIFNFPWKESMLVRRDILYPHSLSVCVILRECYAFKKNFDNENADFSDAKIKLKFKDNFDGEEIEGIGYIKRTIFETGSKWFYWLKYFNKPKVSTLIWFDFSNEVGKEKGTYKGGVIGSSCDYDYKLNLHDNIENFCKKKNLTLLEWS